MSLALMTKSQQDWRVQSEEAWDIVKDAEARLWADLRPFLAALRDQVHQWTVRINSAAAERQADYWNSKYDPGEQHVMRECLEWVVQTVPEWRYCMKGLWPSYDVLGKHSQHALLSDDGSVVEVGDAIQTWATNPLGRMLPDLEEFLGILLDKHLALGASLQIYEFHPRLFTEAFHPPRYTSLRAGINERRFLSDLEEAIRAGKANAQEIGRFSGNHLQVSAGTEELIDQWIEECVKLLRGLQVSEHSLDAGRDVANEFLFFVQNWRAYINPSIVNEPRFASCVLSLGTLYLEEVRKNMPDYVESSGQKSQPQYSINISGGTIYGPVAMRLEAINSTIAGIMEQGTADLAEALESLEKAILADTQSDDELRQDLLDNLEVLANEAQSAPQNRKRGVIKSIIGSLKAAANSGPEIAKAMETWGGIITSLTS